MKRPPQQYCAECKRITDHVRGRRVTIDRMALLLGGAGPHCLPCLRYIVRQARADPEGFTKATGFKAVNAADQPGEYMDTLARVFPKEHAERHN